MMNNSPSLMDKLDEHRMNNQDNNGGSDKVDQIIQLVGSLSDEEKNMLMDQLMDMMESKNNEKKQGVDIVIGVGKPKDNESENMSH